jgi:MFS superfamily sulfate permease-like transporter
VHPSMAGDAGAVAISVSTMITLQAGLFSFILGFFRLGFIDVVLSQALLQGFISAVAVVIMVSVLAPLPLQTLY